MKLRQEQHKNNNDRDNYKLGIATALCVILALRLESSFC